MCDDPDGLIGEIGSLGWPVVPVEEQLLPYDVPVRVPKAAVRVGEGGAAADLDDAGRKRNGPSGSRTGLIHTQAKGSKMEPGSARAFVLDLEFMHLPTWGVL